MLDLGSWRVLVLVLATSHLSSNSSASGDDRPSFVVIMADDMGFSDLGCHGVEIPAMEGQSLAPVLRGESFTRQPMFWEHEWNRAVRVVDWKLVALGQGDTWELYNLARDRTELSDLSAKEPERVVSMRALWESWAKRCRVLPSPRSGKKSGAREASEKTSRKARKERAQRSS